MAMRRLTPEGAKNVALMMVRKEKGDLMASMAGPMVAGYINTLSFFGFALYADDHNQHIQAMQRNGIVIFEDQK